MSVDIGELAQNMIAAASSSLGTSWQKARGTAEPQLEELARLAGEIAQKAVSKEISEPEAKVLLKIQWNTTKTVLLEIEGLAVLALEAAINAVLGVLQDTVNTTLGFEII